MQRVDSLEKTDAGRDWGQEEKGTTEDEMAGWHNPLNGHEFVMPSNHLVLCHPLLLLPSTFPVSGSFKMSQLFASGGQSIGVSASTSVLPMNTKD